MNTAITTLKNDIDFAKKYINDKNIKGIELELKLKQIEELEKAIKILEQSERQESTETSEQSDSKALHIADVSGMYSAEKVLGMLETVNDVEDAKDLFRENWIE